MINYYQAVFEYLSLFLPTIVDWIGPKQLETEKYDELLSLRGQPDPDWTPICTLGAWPNPKSGFNLVLFLRFHLDPKMFSALSEVLA